MVLYKQSVYRGFCASKFGFYVGISIIGLPREYIIYGFNLNWKKNFCTLEPDRIERYYPLQAFVYQKLSSISQ